MKKIGNIRSYLIEGKASNHSGLQIASLEIEYNKMPILGKFALKKINEIKKEMKR